MIERICVECATAFLVKPSKVRRGEGKFCSASCRSVHTGRTVLATRARASRVTRACLVCSAPISVKPSHAAKEGKYCSRACMAKAYAVRQRGADNPNYRHGRAHTRAWKLEREQAFYRRHPHLRRLRNLHAKGVLVSARDLRRMYHRQRGECAICAIPLGDRFQADHIVPLVRGGVGTVGNIQLTCARCNQRKKDRLMADFRLRVLHEYLALPRPLALPAPPAVAFPPAA